MQICNQVPHQKTKKKNSKWAVVFLYLITASPSGKLSCGTLGEERGQTYLDLEQWNVTALQFFHTINLQKLCTIVEDSSLKTKQH